MRQESGRTFQIVKGCYEVVFGLRGVLVSVAVSYEIIEVYN